MNGIITIAAGYGHSIALKNNGDFLDWGANALGQLGNGTNISSNFPVQPFGLCIVLNSIKESTEILSTIVYPNPTNATFSISGLAINTFKFVEILDVSGACVLTSNFYTDIDIANLRNGFYFYRVNGDVKYTGKIIKQ